MATICEALEPENQRINKCDERGHIKIDDRGEITMIGAGIRYMSQRLLVSTGRAAAARELGG
jgi:hypothetical protein